MALSKISPRHKKIAWMALKGVKIKDIAPKVGMHQWSVYRILQDPKVKDYLNEISSYMYKRCIEKQLDRLALRR
ncbi:hypothetical protein ACFL5H_03420 [Candidatus Latescibacterota bacterium]